MAWRNGEHGYGAVTKWLHWLTVAALAAQFAVGYTMDPGASDRADERVDAREEACEAQRDRGEGAEERCEEALERAEERFDEGYAVLDGTWGLLDLHVGLGLLILVLAVLRVAWRRTGLPPWAETLGEGERSLAHWTEKVLLATLFAIPLTGLALVAAGDDDWLWLHVAAHVTFFVAITAHVGLVLKHQLVDRDRLLSRMT